MAFRTLLDAAHRKDGKKAQEKLEATSEIDLANLLRQEFLSSSTNQITEQPHWPAFMSRFALEGICPKNVSAIQKADGGVVWNSNDEVCTCATTSTASFTRFKHIAQLVTVCSKGETFLAGEDQGKVSVIENATMIINKNGKIVGVGRDEELATTYVNSHIETDVDCTGMSIVPGLVDAHTHPVWAGDRVHEFAMKLAGATYMEIHKQGGGIGFTVRHTRESTEDQLLDGFLERARRMVAQGTTTLEAKSGYGLDCETEMKMLKVLHRAKALTPLEISATYLGAHSVPKGSTANEYTKDILEVQLPALKKLRDEKQISPDAIDIFFEKGVFEEEDTRKILKAGAALGLNLNFHGDELHPMAAGELAGELGALAVSHLEEISESGIEAMAKRPSVAVLLPTTAYILRLKPPPARRMIEKRVPVALGSDFNPNAHCLSMPAVMNFACVLLRMTMQEALAAATINAAASIGRSNVLGSLEPGKYADFVIIGSPRWEHIIYEMVDPPILQVFKHGKQVFKRN